MPAQTRRALLWLAVAGPLTLPALASSLGVATRSVDVNRMLNAHLVMRRGRYSHALEESYGLEVDRRAGPTELAITPRGGAVVSEYINALDEDGAAAVYRAIVG